MPTPSPWGASSSSTAGRHSSTTSAAASTASPREVRALASSLSRGLRTRTVRSGATGSRFHTVLSDFERRLVDGVMAGRSSHDLGELHHLSARTIEWHLTRIYRRLQVANRRELRDVVSAWGEKP